MGLRVGMIACGGIARHHWRGWSQVRDRAEVVALVDVSLGNRAWFKQHVPQAKAAPDNLIDLDTLRQSVGRWRRAALGGLAAAMLLAVVLGWSVLSQPGPVVVAVLLDDRGEAIALVEGGRDNTTQITLLERPDMPSNQVMQVWTKPDDDGPPVSLGLLSTGRSDTLTIEGLPTPSPRQLYEITLEPAGGSPTNLPTGPIFGKGLAKAPVT